MTERIAGPEPYLPRNGEAIDEYVDILAKDPQTPLTAEQKADCLRFREELLFGSVTLANGSEVKAWNYVGEDSLEAIEHSYRYTENMHEVTLDYFLSIEGRELLAEKGLLGVFGVDEVTTKEQLKKAFYRHGVRLGHDLLEELADKSKAAVDAQMVEAVANDTPFESPERLTVFDDATNLVRRIRGLQMYRSFFRNVSSELSKEHADTNDNLAAAKKAIITVYLKQVNGQLAAAYPDLFAFLEQTQYMPKTELQQYGEALQHLLPNVLQKSKDFSAAKRGRFMVRLDRIRNGASKRSDGKFSAISPDLESYLADQKIVEQEKEPPLFNAEQIEIMRKIKFNASQMKDFLTLVLSKLGMLSAIPPDGYSRDRPHRAEDELWQIVVREDLKSMSADDPQGMFVVPATFNRNLIKATAPVGVVPVTAHELKHAVQFDNIRDSPGSAGIGKTLYGRRTTVLREAGAIETEQRIQSRFFGVDRADSPHYLRALAAIEAGASELEAVRVFYDSYRTDNPTETPKNAAEVAVSRVMRLTRKFGGYNSQPLNYAETGLLLRKTQHLPEKIRALLFDYGALEIEDLAKLHTFDLLPDEIKPFPYEEFIAIVTPVLEDLIAKHQEQA